MLESKTKQANKNKKERKKEKQKSGFLSSCLLSFSDSPLSGMFTECSLGVLLSNRGEHCGPQNSVIVNFLSTREDTVILILLVCFLQGQRAALLFLLPLSGHGAGMLLPSCAGLAHIPKRDDEHRNARQ